MTKLTDSAERAIRQLDEEDDVDDPEMRWADREPYRRRLSELLASSQEVLGIKALARVGIGAEHYAPAKRKQGEHRPKPDPLGYAVDDVLRLKNTLPDAAAEQVAAERYRRGMPHDGLWGQWCTVDKLSDLDEGWAELDEIAGKLHKRLHRGPTGAERRRKKKARAK